MEEEQVLYEEFLEDRNSLIQIIYLLEKNINKLLIFKRLLYSYYNKLSKLQRYNNYLKRFRKKEIIEKLISNYIIKLNSEIPNRKFIIYEPSGNKTKIEVKKTAKVQAIANFMLKKIDINHVVENDNNIIFHKPVLYIVDYKNGNCLNLNNTVVEEIPENFDTIFIVIELVTKSKESYYKNININLLPDLLPDLLPEPIYSTYDKYNITTIYYIQNNKIYSYCIKPKLNENTLKKLETINNRGYNRRYNFKCKRNNSQRHKTCRAKFMKTNSQKRTLRR